MADYGGEGGIRTHGRISPTHAFQACSLNRSDTSPLVLEQFSRKEGFAHTSSNQTDAPDGRLASSAVLLRFELHALLPLRATLAVGPVFIDSKRFALLPWRPRQPTRPDISTLLKTGILILQR